KKDYLEKIKNKKVLTVGFGRSGKAAAGILSGFGIDVTVQDSRDRSSFDASLLGEYEEKGVKFMLGEEPEDPSSYDVIVLSPGVSPETPFVSEAAAAGSEITGELEIAYRLCEGTFIGITGTNGKTTTTTMVGDIFRKAGRRTSVVGNIGVPVMSQAVEAGADEWLVTECSSFQLETTSEFRPSVSAILNVTPDHLDRHHTMEAYAAAKAKVFANQTARDHFVTNADDPICAGLAEKCGADVVYFSGEKEVEKGAFVRDGVITLADGEGSEYPVMKASELRVIGQHNVMNALAASAICFFSGIDPETIGAALREFPGVEHRIEFCGEIDGVKYYNDSKGTNTDAAETALRAVGKDIILIAGGDAKGQDFTDFARMFEGRVKELILLGRDRGMIEEAADKAGYKNYTECDDMEACVSEAAKTAVPGDTVLLSPACASWDMYDNYEQRGEHFKKCVEKLKNQ
ncbi:MAG: UDP-N-acetylmuramoyl-L-alanine--D-glutamate ligase, partial [Anaerovoracaceae bacterium]